MAKDYRLNECPKDIQCKIKSGTLFDTYQFKNTALHGLSNEQIAYDLGISVSTVEKKMAKAYLECNSNISMLELFLNRASAISRKRNEDFDKSDEWKEKDLSIVNHYCVGYLLSGKLGVDEISNESKEDNFASACISSEQDEAVVWFDVLVLSSLFQAIHFEKKFSKCEKDAYEIDIKSIYELIYSKPIQSRKMPFFIKKVNNSIERWKQFSGSYKQRGQPSVPINSQFFIKAKSNFNATGIGVFCESDLQFLNSESTKQYVFLKREWLQTKRVEEEKQEIKEYILYRMVRNDNQNYIDTRQIAQQVYGSSASTLKRWLMTATLNEIRKASPEFSSIVHKSGKIRYNAKAKKDE